MGFVIPYFDIIHVRVKKASRKEEMPRILKKIIPV